MTAIDWSSEKPQHKPVSISSQAQLLGRPSVQDSTAAASAGSVLWKVLSTPLSPKTPALKIRTVMYLEKKTLTPPTTYQHPCLSFLLPPNPLHPCPLCQARLQETGIGLSLPSSQVPFPLLAQILGQFNPKEAWDWWVRGKSLCLSRASVALDSLRLSVRAGLIIPL